MSRKVNEKRITPRSFKLIPNKIDEDKVLKELLDCLGIESKQSITRRKKYSPIEKEAVENIFKKYGVKQVSKIWNY
ncbi:hypothetical protein AS589_09200 [Empedobacter brevis]|uniref:hypothetical protein n=1 Tax=Empedobacter brevis TaxID=247 RepID=UPI00131FC58E|nr:hypothetical protein [Empedobacter brevis]QHC84932.1 hypothetical protein AS589_09200 [Empedobacter brevis]